MGLCLSQDGLCCEADSVESLCDAIPCDDIGHRPQPLASDTSLNVSSCHIDPDQLDKLLEKLASTDFNVHKTNKWSRPVKYVRVLEMEIRFHRNMTDYVKARSFRLRNKIVIEPRRMSQGRPVFPEFFQPFLNKRVKVYMRTRPCVKDTVFRRHIAEYDYLLKHVAYVTLRIFYDLSNETGLTIKVEIQENHRIRKQRGAKVRKTGRVMYATHVWVVHGNHPTILLKGMEFKLYLMPGPASRDSSSDDPLIEATPVIGNYQRSLDSTSYAENILATWTAELKQPTEIATVEPTDLSAEPSEDQPDENNDDLEPEQDDEAAPQGNIAGVQPQDIIGGVQHQDIIAGVHPEDFIVGVQGIIAGVHQEDIIQV